LVGGSVEDMEQEKNAGVNPLPVNLSSCTSEELANGLKFVSNGQNSVTVEFVFSGINLSGTGFSLGEAYDSLYREVSAICGESN